MNRDRTYAKRIFTSYFRHISEQAGMQWDSDNTTEIEEAVDSIIDAAKKELRSDDTVAQLSPSAAAARANGRRGGRPRKDAEMTIKTNYPVNFTKAENENFSWNSSWKDLLRHKASGRSIYQMMWVDTKEPVEPEVKAAASRFWNELEMLKKAPSRAREDYMSDAEYDERKAFERKMNDPNSDY